MVYKKEIGFSNIRIPNENADLLYTYSQFNTFPEEVFIHEFLHNLERVEEEYGNEIPKLHDYEQYGYKESEIEGLKEWYKDYMTTNISNKKVGLTKNVFTNKPVHESCFKETIDLTQEFFYEPEDLVGKIKAFIEKVGEQIETERDYNENIRV